jgi:hypothetical protein
MKLRLITAGFTLTLLFCAGVSAQPAASVTAPTSVVKAGKYYRTELYLGMSIPSGGAVSEEDWEKFLVEVVTPEFPDGFTILAGRGQYREASGTIAKEPSHVLVFLYVRSERKSAGAKIENIRREYKKRFSQESVLRVDITKSVLVSF